MGRSGRDTDWGRGSVNKLGSFLVRGGRMSNGALGWCPESSADRVPLDNVVKRTDSEVKYF